MEMINYIFFPNVEIELPKDIIEVGYNQLNLFTTIQVFEDEVLTNWQCSLNLPQKIMNMDCEYSIIEKVKFKYQIAQKPGFQVTI